MPTRAFDEVSLDELRVAADWVKDQGLGVQRPSPQVHGKMGVQFRESLRDSPQLKTLQRLLPKRFQGWRRWPTFDRRTILELLRFLDVEPNTTLRHGTRG